MHSKLSYWLKIDCYNCKIVYVSLMITTKQISIIDTQKTERGTKSYHYKKSSAHNKRKKEEGKQSNYNKTARKQ